MYSFGKYLLRTYCVPENVDIIISRPNRMSDLQSNWDLVQLLMTQLEGCLGKADLTEWPWTRLHFPSERTLTQVSKENSAITGWGAPASWSNSFPFQRYSFSPALVARGTETSDHKCGGWSQRKLVISVWRWEIKKQNLWAEIKIWGELGSPFMVPRASSSLSVWWG